MIKSLRIAVIWCSFLAGSRSFDQSVFGAQPAPAQMRRPVAAAVIHEGNWLATANQRSGTISIFDLHDRVVVRETTVGKRLSDIIAMTNPQRLLVTDEEAHELVSVLVSPKGC